MRAGLVLKGKSPPLMFIAAKGIAATIQSGDMKLIVFDCSKLSYRTPLYARTLACFSTRVWEAYATPPHIIDVYVCVKSQEPLNYRPPRSDYR